jgi:hypothetical protein
VNQDDVNEHRRFPFGGLPPGGFPRLRAEAGDDGRVACRESSV